jgi:hypothetical protein
MTTIVKAASAAQFLSLVPRMLGCRPSRSLVLIPFHASRSHGGMRFDLPDTDDDVEAFASTALGLVCRIPDVDGVAAVIYSDDSLAVALPRQALVDALSVRADACGMRLTDALCVGPDAWGSYLDADLPRGGRPLAELTDEPDGVAHLAVEPDQTSGAELPASDLADRELVAGALRSLADAVDLLCGTDGGAGASAGDQPRVDPLALSAVCDLDDLPTLFENALGWDPDKLAPYDAATLVWCLTRPALRDIALVEWCGGLAAGDDAFDAQLRWEAGEEYPAHLAMHMWGEGDRPEPERLETALALARRAASLAPNEMRAGPLATCAWLSWALGRSTHAERYAVHACDIEAEHGLAEIVRSFVLAGHLPDWAFRPR